jgi:hypothetical protein
MSLRRNQDLRRRGRGSDVGCTFPPEQPMAASSRWRFGVAIAVILASAAACHPGGTGRRSASRLRGGRSREPWASNACDESRWLRHVILAVGGRIVGLVDGIEPQPRDAFLVSLDGKTFFGAISHRVFKANGGWWSMGQFSAGMPDAGSVDGVALSGNHRMGHWSWQVHHFIVQVYPDPENDSALPDLVGRPLASRLLRATLSTEP